MKYLSEKNKALLLEGAKTCGSFEEGFQMIDEQVNIDEFETLEYFCEFLDHVVGGAGSGNIDKLFDAFIVVKTEADKIERIRGIMNKID